tara:strand:- start:1425 stop:3515 length:2091 start_codon:yes stop_codon:yes gene_type:complete
MINKSDVLIFSLSLLIGIIFTTLFLGLTNIGFENTDWFTSYDLKSDLLAFKFFLNDKWRFPIGSNPNYGEILNSIVFSGAVPIFSIIVKLFKSVLSEDFHFFSVWIVLCFSLQFLFGYKIIYYLTKNNLYSLLAGVFFLISPILIYRLNFHLSLSAHWLILAGIFLDLNKNQKNILFKKILLIVFSSLVHFYFTIILVLMNLFFSFFNNNLKFKYNFFKENFLIFLSLSFTMYVVGYFHIPATDALGFGYGYYKTNFLSFIDPIPSANANAWSIILPDIYNFSGEREGFAYLGLGILILIFYIIMKNIKNLKNIQFNYKYFSLCLFLFLLALSNNVSFGQLNLVSINLPNFVYAPLSILRASGRLIWPVYYIIIIFTIFKLYKLEQKNKLSLIIVFLFIQIFDFSNSLNENFLKEKKVRDNKLNDPIWEFVSENYNNISTTKISNRTESFKLISNFLIDNNFESTNYFRLGRYNREFASEYRSKFVKKLMLKEIDSNKAFIIENKDQLRHLKFLFKDSNHGFFKRNGLWILLPQQRKLMTESDLLEFKSVKSRLVSDEVLLIKENSKEGILGLGWSHPNYGRSIGSSGVWSEGYFSSFIFKTEDAKINSINITLKQVFTHKNEDLKIKILINNENFKEISLNVNSKEILLNDIKKYLINDDNVITLNILNPSTPLSKLTSIDGRLLGVLVEKIVFN